ASGHGARSARHERARCRSHAREARSERARVWRRLRRLSAAGRRRADRRRRRLPPGSGTLALAARGDCEPPMTWAELHGALRGRGLIQADDALRAEAAVGAVAGIAYDSRTVAPGQVFVALKGQHADGTAF